MDTSVYIAVIFYRIVTVLCGLGFAYLGYRLFCLGITKEAGEFQAKMGDRSLMLRQVAPGVFFALFGVIVTSVSIVKGFNLSSDALIGPHISAVNSSRPYTIGENKEFILMRRSNAAAAKQESPPIKEQKTIHYKSPKQKDKDETILQSQKPLSK